MMPATPAQEGPLLRDIHLPPDPSWWPPAPGWWLLAGVLLALLALATWFVWRRRQRRERIAELLADVEALERRHAGEPARLAAALHELLRRAARRYDPGATHHRGEAWRQCLAKVPVDAVTIERLMALEDAMYRPQAAESLDGGTAAVRTWLARALEQGVRRQRRAVESAHA